MQGRPHAERLRSELSAIRAELTQEVQQLRPDELDWAPRPDMKTFRQLLQEIGTMEKVCVHWLLHNSILDWQEVERSFADAGKEPATFLQELEQVRTETLRYLDACSEEQTQTPLSLP